MSAQSLAEVVRSELGFLLVVAFPSADRVVVVAAAGVEASFAEVGAGRGAEAAVEVSGSVGISAAGR